MCGEAYPTKGYQNASRCRWHGNVFILMPMNNHDGTHFHCTLQAILHAIPFQATILVDCPGDSFSLGISLNW